MFFRAAVAFLVLPGVVAGLLPALLCILFPWHGVGMPAGYVLIVIGLALLLWCVRDFYVSGKGTLAPWAPPRRLVVVGLYRFVRNPMYIAVLLILIGWYAATASPSIASYTLGVAVAFHLRVVLNEEPRLASKFGTEWLVYSRSAGRWFPRLRHWLSDQQPVR